MSDEPAELSVEQTEALQSYMAAMVALGEAQEKMAALGLDLGTALRHLPGSEPGRSALDELPPMLRMMIA